MIKKFVTVLQKNTCVVQCKSSKVPAISAWTPKSNVSSISEKIQSDSYLSANRRC